MSFENVRFTNEHEWVRFDDSDVVVMGITDFAVAELGDIVYVELPESGAVVEAGESTSWLARNGSKKSSSTLSTLYTMHRSKLSSALTVLPARSRPSKTG